MQKKDSMQQKEATIYDVAKEAGVSAATVSRVLNDPSKVNSEKRDSVMAAIDALHFVPKAAAVANARQSYRKIAIIAPFFTEPSFMQRLRGISRIISGHHYELVIYTIESQEELEEYIDMISSSRRVDALIVLCLTLRPAALSRLRNCGIPVCFVESDVEGFDCVVIENELGGKLAAQNFYDMGCRKPGFIGEASNKSYAVPATEDRLRGYTEFFRKKHIPIRPDHIWLGEFTEKKIDEGISDFLNQEDLPDCIFTSSDLIAVRLIKIAAVHTIRIPEDIQVTGFDDLDITEHLNLSTVSQNLDDSGKTAAELVLARLADPSRDPRKVHIGLKVINRSTTGSITGSK